MSVGYKVRHTTTFNYPIPVSVCHNIVCLTPRPDPCLTIHSASLAITPQPTVVSERVDTFGNITHVFSIEEPHDALVVDASLDVTVHDPRQGLGPGKPWEQVSQSIADQSDSNWLETESFLYDSPLVARSQDAKDLIAQLFTPGRPISEATIALTKLIHQTFKYQPGATNVGTNSDTALRNRQGVCQDFAHAMIAALRSVGLPARYVSGYLRTMPPPGRPKLVGVDQSHAWASVYMGEQLGWQSFDPTNGIACGVDHIPIAVGRDYTDIAPIRGAFLGGGDSQLVVTVDVDEKQPQTAMK